MNSNIMLELTSKSTSTVYNALVTIRTDFIKHASIMEHFQREGIVKLLISFMEQPKFCNISLSILATCCLQHGFCREVIERGGVLCLSRILKGLANDEILNRVVRAFGNIALFRQGANEIRKHDIIKSLLALLTNTQDPNCQQSILRTLRIIGEDREQKKKIISLNGIVNICKLLTSQNEFVLKVCVKTLGLLTGSCSIECALQIQKADALPVLVNLYYNKCKEIRRYALIIFENLACLTPMVESLSNNKVLEIFVKVASSSDNDVKTIQGAALSLCLCCKHYQNRDKIRKLGVVPFLIKILRNDEFIGIQNEILPALVNLCSEINDLDKLRELQLLPVCIQLLKNYVEQNKKEHDFQRKKETVVDIKHISKKLKDTYVPEARITRSVSSSGSNDAIFSIHSPTYQGLQFSEPSTSGTYRSYVSPLSSVQISSSPEFSYDWNPSSPMSCSSPLGPWSPSSSNNDQAGMCWSPVMSSHSNTPDSSPNQNNADDIHVSDPDEVDPKINLDASTSASMMQTTVTTNESAPSILPLAESQPDTVAEPKTGPKASKIQKTTVRKRRHSSQNSDSNDSYHSQPPHELGLVSGYLSSPRPKKQSPLRLEESKVPVKGIDHCILTLLAHLAYNLEKTCNSEIVEEINVGVLMDYVAQLPSPNQKASKILYSLISNRYSFEKLVICNFIGQLETRIKTPHDTELCRRCHRLLGIKNKLLLMGRLIAESEFGVGALIHVMVITDSASQLNCLYAIAKLVESKKLLWRILFASKGFKNLKKYLTSECKSDFETAVQCLSMISVSVVGKYEYRSATKSKAEPTQGSCQFGNHGFDLTIVLDDGSKVSASRELLSSNCEFFSLMLQGQFAEASQSVVSLPSISKDVLLLILHLLHGCSAENCIYWAYLNTEILLKLLEASDRFLLPSIKSMVQEKILEVMGLDDLCDIYSAAKLYSPPLMTSVLHFLLCCPFTDKSGYSKVVQNVIALESREFFKNLKQLLKKHIIV